MAFDETNHQFEIEAVRGALNEICTQWGIGVGGGVLGIMAEQAMNVLRFLPFRKQGHTSVYGVMGNS